MYSVAGRKIWLARPDCRGRTYRGAHRGSAASAGRVSKFLAGLAFIGFTVATGLLCIVVLSATLTQARISGFAIEGVSLSIWKLDTVRLRAQQQKQALGDAEIKRAETSGQKTAAEPKPSSAGWSTFPDFTSTLGIAVNRRSCKPEPSPDQRIWTLPARCLA
jgi:hypothetical protein